ncbi:NPCBM/NEW2 domain-containing protein, partial [Rubritalea squalenifaciens DSM 18772]
MKLRDCLFTVFLSSAGLSQAQLENLPQVFKPLDVSHLNTYYPGPHGGWFPSGIDQQTEARQRYLYLGPLGVQGLAHVPEYMYRESCKAITNPALRSSHGEIEIPYYEVLGVDPKAPAASFLLAGDLIVGVDGVDLKSGSLYNPDNDYSTKNTRTLFECLGDAIDRAEGTGSITFNVMRLPANLPPTTTIPDRYVEVHRTDLVDNYEDRNIEIDVSAAGMMKLIAENAGDGNGNDHAYWLEARWVKTDGTEVLVTDQEWLSISVGYGSPTWGNQITYSGGTTTNSLFAHAPSEVLFKVPDGMDKFRVTLRNNSYGSIIGSLKTSAVEVDYGDLEQYITDVTIPVAKIGSYLAGGAEREHKLEQMIVSQSAWLLGEQRADGGWSSLGSYTSDIWDTAYIGLAMLAADEPRFDEAAKRAAYYIVNEGRVTDWSSPRGIVLTFLGEYYLRTGDEGILPGLQVAVNMVEQNLLAQGYAGHKIGYGYGTGGQNSGFSYMAMGLAVASRTPVEVDKNLLDKMLVRMDAMAVNGTIGYGRSTSTTFNANAGAVNAVAMTGPCVAANSITGTSQRFFDLSKAAMERSVGGLDFGHSSQTYGLFGGTLSTINLGDALYLRHQELTMPKMILQRYYAGGVIASECRNEFMGAEGFFRPRMATAIQVLTLAAGRKNLAITGKSELQAATMKPGHYTHVWDMETHRFWMRAWSVAIELLGDDAPASLYTGYNALKTVSYDGALNELHDDIYAALETHALTAVGDINALTGVSDQLKAEAIEMLLGMDLNIQVTEKDTDLADVSLSAYWPLRERNRWADSATQNAWKANASYITSGSISIANGGALSSDVTIAFDSSTAGTDMKQGYSSSLGTVQVTRLDGANTFTLPVQISYTVGSHSISYTRDVTFEAGLGGNVEDARYVTIPSCRVLRKTKGDELVVEMERTGEYLQMHGPLPAVFHQGEKVSVEFKQLNLALGGHRNATTLGSPLTWYRGVAFSATPGATMTQGDIDNLLDANVGTSSRSQTQSGQTWAGFEMDLGSAKLINGILIEDQGYNVYKVEAEIGGEWTQIFSGGFFTGPDYFGDYTVQKLRIYWQTNGSGYTPNITDIQVFYNAYGSSETEVAQNHEDGVSTHWRLWQEKYNGLSSGTIAALTSNVNYPDSPSYSGFLYEADSGSNIGDNYGQRWTGWITPDETGDFVFYAAADDQVELYLSTDEHPSNKGLIASKYTWTSAYNWSGGAISAPVSLIAGKKYYIELLHAEGGGGDNCAIAWKKPSDTAAPANGTAGIGESYFSTVVGGVNTNVNYVYPAITSQPSAVVATAGQPASFSLVAGGAGSLSYQWMKNGVVVPGANAATYSIASASAADAGTYTCMIRNEYGQVLSQGADLSFTNQSPVATDASFSLSEGVTVGTSVGSVTATDPDVGTALSYAITAGNTENVFTINTATGEISTAGGLDYEYLNGYLLEVTVTDNGSPALSDTALVAITVDNAYDVAPIMADVDAKVVDDVVAGTLVAQMSAFDPEDGDSVSFSITAGNIGGAFVIDSSTGRVTTATSLDSTVTGIYSLEVTATDLGGASDTATLDVIVFKAVGAIAWNFSQRGDSTMVQGDGSIFGTDQWTDSVDHAAPNGTVAANSTDSWAVTTPINASMVSVAWSSSNMYQSGNSTTLVDQLFRKYLDDGGAGPQISVSGLNQWLSGVGASNYTVTFYQGSDASNNNFAQMNIYDGSDTSGTLLESMPATLTDGSGAGGGSRLVRIADGLFTGDAITFHTDRSLGGGNRASVSGFKITAVQYPNSAPLADNATVSLAEDAVVGTAVATVNATDPDVEDILTYSITAGNGGGEFAINSSTGEITTTTALDYEAAAQYVLTVEVSDGSLTDTATITVDVTNVNEAPVANGASGNVNEDAAVGSTVATVTSSDPDAGDSATYAITAGNDGSFAINSSTGVITTAAGLDYETTSSYTLTV